MSAKKRLKIRAKPKKKRPSDPGYSAIMRMTKIMLEHKLPKDDIKKAYSAIYDHLFLRLRQIVSKYEKEQSWDFMKGAYYQATELYVVASLAYYKYDNPIMTDAQYDDLCKFLHDHYTDIPITARTEYRLSADLLRAGSGYIFEDASKYPSLYHYDQRLMALKQERHEKRERRKAKDTTGLLRQAPVKRRFRRPVKSRKRT